MADTPTVTSTQIPPAIQLYYDRNLLQHGKPYLIHGLFAQKKVLPQKNTDTIKFRRYNALPESTTPITEGVTPTGFQATTTEITATVQMYGGHITYTDVVSLINPDPVLTQLSTELADQAGRSLDTVHRDVFVAGTNVYYAGSYAANSIDTRGEEYTATTAADFDKVRVIMEANYAETIAAAMRAGSGQGTMPGPACYFAICSHELHNDLMDMTGFLPAYQYPQASAYESEIGMLPSANIRFLTTQKAKIWTDSGGTTGAGTTYRSTSGSNVDVYSILVFGKNATGIVDLSGKSMETIIKPLGSSGSADPHNQRGSIAWNAWTTAVILNDLFMIRCEFAATL